MKPPFAYALSALRSLLAKQPVSVREAARISGLDVEMLCDTLFGARPIGAQEAAGLARLFDIPADYWLAKQQHYDDFTFNIDNDEHTDLRAAL